MKPAYLASFALLLAGSASAYQPLVTDDTGTQGADGNQIEVAATRDRVDDSSRSRQFAAVYTRGLTDTLDVFVQAQRLRNTDTLGLTESGLGNVVLGAKWRFWENESGTSFGFKPSLVFPVSADKEVRGLGTGKTSFDLTLIATQATSWGAVHANLGAGQARYRNSAADEDNTHFSIAPVLHIGEHVKLALDIGVDRSSSSLATTRSSYRELGFVYAPTENLEFALGFIRTRDHATSDDTSTVTGGVTWRFK